MKASEQQSGGFRENDARVVRNALRRHWPALIAVALFSLGINVLMLTGPIFMLQIYGRVLPGNSVETLVVLFVLVAFLFAVLGALDLVRARVLGRVATQLALDLRERLFLSAMRTSLRTGNQEMASQPLRELDVMIGFLSGPAVIAFYDAPLVPVYIFVIYLLHPLLSVLAIVAALVLFALAVFNDLFSRGPQADSLKATSRAQHFLAAGLRNAEALKAMGMMRRLQALWRANHDAALWHQIRTRSRIGDITSVSKALRLLIQSSMLALGAWLVIRGEITAGAMIAASIIVGRALQPVEQAITSWRAYQRYRAARARIEKALREDPPMEQLRRTVPELTPKGHLQVQELFVGPPGVPAPYLQNISFEIPPGKLLVVVGPNGSGKTMLARALAGVWMPMKGSVKLDGADLRIWPEDMLGSLTGYVPQDVELIDGTVGENIARFDPDATEEDIIEAARKAGVDESIKAMGGYDAPVGPGGRFLSAGQRQRVALARALYKNPVLLVLDEPNSNLDPEGEAAFLKALTQMRERGQTVVLVDHGDKALHISDYIIILKGGRMIRGGPREKIFRTPSSSRHSGKSKTGEQGHARS